MGDSLKTYLLVSEKPWHDALFNELSETTNGRWVRITNKAEFSAERISELNPEKIFIPHWSYIIPENIYNGFECIVFHMTDLPFGRGGSPLQNLIVRGFAETMISAIKVSEGIDAGDIYLKRRLSLEGSAKEIFNRAASVIAGMIREIMSGNLKPYPQTGAGEVFKRRKREEGNIALLSKLETIYDYVRMLDCEGYPKAFLETEHFIFEFTNAHLNNNESVTANVRIIKK